MADGQRRIDRDRPGVPAPEQPNSLVRRPERHVTRATLRGAPEIDDQPGQTLRMLAHRPVHGIRNRLELVAAKAGRDQDDPGVVGVPRHRIVGQHKEIDDVGGDDRSSTLGRLGELRPVFELNFAHLVRTDGIEAPVPEYLGDDRRQILVEVDLHPVVTKRTSPG